MAAHVWYYLDPDNNKEPKGRRFCERCKRRVNDYYRIILHDYNPWYRIATEKENTNNKIGIDCHKKMVKLYGKMK